MPGGAPPTSGPPPGAGPPPPWGYGSPPPPGAAGFTSRYGLVRPRKGRYLAGVCAAIGRATNTDPVLWRVLLAVLGLLRRDRHPGLRRRLADHPGRGRHRVAGRVAARPGPVQHVAGDRDRPRRRWSAVMFGFIVTDAFRAIMLGAAILIGGALLLNRNARTHGYAAPTPAGAPPTPGPAFGPAAGPAPSWPSSGGTDVVAGRVVPGLVPPGRAGPAGYPGGPAPAAPAYLGGSGAGVRAGTRPDDSTAARGHAERAATGVGRDRPPRRPPARSPRRPSGPPARRLPTAVRPARPVAGGAQPPGYQPGTAAATSAPNRRSRPGAVSARRRHLLADLHGDRSGGHPGPAPTGSRSGPPRTSRRRWSPSRSGCWSAPGSAGPGG